MTHVAQAFRPAPYRASTTRLLAAAILSSGVAGAAQQVYRANADVVLVDMRVMRDDAQVTDLRADEVTLLVDGTPRPILSLVYYPSPSGGVLSASHPVGGQIAGRPDRRIVLVVHTASIAPGEGPKALKAAKGFIERLPSEYALAVVSLPLAHFPPEHGVQFDRDRRTSLRALTGALTHTSRIGLGMENMAGFGCTGAAASEGCGDPGQPLLPRDRPVAHGMSSSAELQVQEAAMLRDLQWLFRAVGDGPSDVVVISGGLPREESLRPEVDRTIEAARLTGVRVHALTMADLTNVALPEGAAPTPPRADPVTVAWPGAYGLPEETGGIEVAGAATGARFFTELAHQVAGSYLLAFEPLPAERDGRPHRIEIRTSRRPRPAIHARRVFVIQPPPVPVAEQHAAAPSVTPGESAGPGKPPAVARAPEPAGSAPAVAPDSGRPSVPALIERAGEYVEHFQQTVSTVVVEERDVQVVKLWSGAPPSPGDEPELAWKQGRGEQLVKRPHGALRRRQVRSDVLLVQIPGRVWVGYRDVAEVDGKAVRDRSTRVHELFMSGRAADRDQLRRIADESSRYNLGTGRNFNTPAFPLQILLASPLSRFTWTREASDAAGPGCCVVLAFSEIASPTMVRTPAGHDVPMKGRLWIEPRTGRIARAMLRFSNRAEEIDGAFDVTYGEQAGLDVLVPKRLWEWYLTPDPERAFGLRRAYVEGQASYGDLRRFTVTTDEAVKRIP